MRLRILKAHTTVTWRSLAAAGEALVLRDNGEVEPAGFWTEDPGIAAQVVNARSDDAIEVAAMPDIDGGYILLPD